MVEDRVVAHELLDLEDVFDLLEVGGDFLGDEAEVFLGVDKKGLGVLVSFVYFLDVEG